MPEGPEVKRITEQLNQELAGKKITMIDIISGRYLYHGPPDGLRGFADTPRLIQSIKCKGKFIYFTLDDDWYIWNTLGMSGGWSKEQDKFSRISFSLDDDSRVYFNDMRNFGTIKFVKSKERLQNKLNSLGPDILIYDMPDSEFKDKITKHSKKNIAQFLMSQKIISGVGNYIKCESLYLARISPHRSCGSLSDLEINNLNKAIKSIIRESYNSGGSTFRTYQDFNGEVGNFGDRFMIYRQEKDPVGRKVIKERTKDKRTTHWVPDIQE